MALQQRGNVTLSGSIRKLKGSLGSPIQYILPLGDNEIALNPLLGQKIGLTYQGVIHCIGCARVIKKSFQQGYCFPCAQTKAACDLCIVRPERCHYHQGTCREPGWGEMYCMIPHIIYLSNTSGLKVGITRGTQVPTRWIDQGAIQALAIARVNTRLEAGLVEVLIAKYLNDKTDWRKMLKGDIPSLDLQEKREEIFSILAPELQGANIAVEALKTESVLNLEYPVISYPSKIQSLNIEKLGSVTGCLLGIKGQYLILDTGVINIRNLTGYDLEFHIL